MPVHDLMAAQRAGVEVGRVRLGKKNANGHPMRLPTLRLTTPSRDIADGVAAVYGGTVAWWEEKKQWEVITEHTDLEVVIPPLEVITQWWEMWGGKPVACLRRCDSQVQQLGERGPCACPADIDERIRLGRLNPPQACLPRTRLRIVLPYVPGLGMWMVTSSGLGAAISLGGQAWRLQKVREMGINLRAKLRVEERTGSKDGKPTRWLVPCLDILDSAAEIASGQIPANEMRLPPPPKRLALTAGTSSPQAPAQQESQTPPAQKPASEQPKPPAPAKPVTEDWPPVAKAPAAAPPAKSLAQTLAERATSATSRGELATVIAEAKEALVTDHLVMIDGAEETLRDYITHLWNKLPARPAAPADAG
jgi:hypothetical protein